MDLKTIGAILLGIINLIIWFTSRSDENNKAKDDINKKIDSANNADDIMRVSGELRK